MVWQSMVWRALSLEWKGQTRAARASQAAPPWLALLAGGAPLPSFFWWLAPQGFLTYANTTVQKHKNTKIKITVTGRAPLAWLALLAGGAPCLPCFFGRGHPKEFLHTQIQKYKHMKLLNYWIQEHNSPPPPWWLALRAFCSFRNTQVEKYRNAKIQKHRNTEVQKYRNKNLCPPSGWVVGTQSVSPQWPHEWALPPRADRCRAHALF